MRSASFALTVSPALFLAAGCHTTSKSDVPFSTREAVGQLGSNRYYTPANQVLTPAGTQVELPGMRPQAIALSPDGRLLVTAGRTHEIVVIDPASGQILQRVPLPANEQAAAQENVSEQILQPDNFGQLSYTGLTFSPDGARLYLANVNGDVKVFSLSTQKRLRGLFTIKLPAAHIGNRTADIPAGIAVSKDGKRLYVVMNLSNHLVELDATTGQVLRTWNVGVAPYSVALAGHKVYVSNWGGRVADSNSVTGPAGRGTLVRVDPVRYIANEGSVTIIDPEKQAVSNVVELLTGLHASGLAVSPNERFVVVANAGSDTLSVLDAGTDQLIETISARKNPADLFGAQPNALAFDKSGHRLFVCNASQNVVAVIDFEPGHSKWLGLIPTAWFPGTIAYDSRRERLYVANIKGIGSTRKLEPGEKPKFTSPEAFGTLSLFPIPNSRELARMTDIALANMRYGLLEQSRLPARSGQPPRPVPERVGEPSVFNHVVYIIQENRTYDQVLGDMAQGNGDPSLCVFGDQVSPNHHKTARDFVLLDNTYCSGVLSADGHQWADSAMANEYLERSFASFPRSYVHGMSDGGIDALAYSSAGFIWDNVIAHGKTLRDYGEFSIAQPRWKDRSKTGSPTFNDYYRDYIEQTGSIDLSCRPAIESLRPYLVTNTVGWALNIPDVIKADRFIKDLKAAEQTSDFAILTIICLPNDHTTGTRQGFPTPAAQVADNDLAFGRILDAISHSRFWKETCVFAIEDDPQAGWDHVSAYRTTCYVASPYTRRRAVVSTQYNQTSLLRTIELMLGLPPMNQLDATATPMSDCFTDVPDLTPFVALPNNVPLDQMNPEPRKVSDALLRKHALISAKLPIALPDQCPEDTLNRIIWHAMKGSASPYPTWAVTPVKDDD